MNYETRGAIVRLSSDGSSWRETAVLSGPVGEEEVLIADIVVSDQQYVIVGDTWSNVGNGGEKPRNMLLRSKGGTNWKATYVDALAEGISAGIAFETKGGLVLAGATWSDGTPSGRPKIWIETSKGTWRDDRLANGGYEDVDPQHGTGRASSAGGAHARGSRRDGVLRIMDLSRCR